MAASFCWCWCWCWASDVLVAVHHLVVAFVEEASQKSPLSKIAGWSSELYVQYTKVEAFLYGLMDDADAVCLSKDLRKIPRRIRFQVAAFHHRARSNDKRADRQ